MRKPLGFTLTDRELDALQDALKSKASYGEGFNPAYSDAAHMIHEARMKSNQRRADLMLKRLRARRQLGI